MSHQVKEEMARLRANNKMHLCYTPLYMMPSGGIHITFQNARSYNKHYHELHSDHNMTSSHIIALTETRLISTDIQHEELGTFSCIRNDQQQTSHLRPPHGQLMFVSNSLSTSAYISYTSTEFECMIITVVLPAKLQVINIYKAPTCTLQQLKHQFEMHLFPNIDISQPYIIGGDFNINVQNNETFVQYMSTKLNCTQQVQEPTTIRDSTVDLVFTNWTPAYSIALYCGWTDHKTIQVSFKHQ